MQTADEALREEFQRLASGPVNKVLFALALTTRVSRRLFQGQTRRVRVTEHRLTRQRLQIARLARELNELREKLPV